MEEPLFSLVFLPKRKVSHESNEALLEDYSKDDWKGRGRRHEGYGKDQGRTYVSHGNCKRDGHNAVTIKLRELCTQQANGKPAHDHEGVRNTNGHILKRSICNDGL